MSAPTPPVDTHPTAAPDQTTVKVWDLPLRLFHWGLALAVSVAIASGLAGGAWMWLHLRAGLVIVALLGFRLAWGFVGGELARFAHFVPTPARLRAYLSGGWNGLGHNPLGALSVFALLLALALQTTSGLFGNDDIAFTGPLAVTISDELSHGVTGWHRVFVKVIYALIGLHLAAIVFYVRIKRKNLVGPMLTGRQQVAPNTRPPAPARRRALVVTLVLAGALTYAASGQWLRTSTARAATPPTSTASAAPAW